MGWLTLPFSPPCLDPKVVGSNPGHHRNQDKPVKFLSEKPRTAEHWQQNSESNVGNDGVVA